jgi:hypothetical protein
MQRTLSWPLPPPLFLMDGEHPLYAVLEVFPELGNERILALLRTHRPTGPASGLYFFYVDAMFKSARPRKPSHYVVMVR